MAKKNDSLGDRMKGYEGVSRNFLTRRVPAIIRLDGKAFHTFTKGMKKPFDSVLTQTMQETMKYLCENIQGCVLGYTQSDEITLVLTDYATIQTDAWFGYNIQKMCSISASMATSCSTRYFIEALITILIRKTSCQLCSEKTQKAKTGCVSTLIHSKMLLLRVRSSIPVLSLSPRKKFVTV